MNTLEYNAEPIKVNANGNETLKMMSIAEEYKTYGFFHLFFAALSVAVYIMFFSNMLFIMLGILAFVNTCFMFYKYKNKTKALGKIDDCYVELANKEYDMLTYFNCKQLFNGKYEDMKVKIEEITKIIRLGDGIQIYLAPQHPNTMILVDRHRADRDILHISSFGYDKADFEKVFFGLCVEADQAEIIETVNEWEEYNHKSDTICMIAPAILYLIPLILSFFL